jgi:hypothetical protein
MSYLVLNFSIIEFKHCGQLLKSFRRIISTYITFKFIASYQTQQKSYIMYSGFLFKITTVRDQVRTNNQIDQMGVQIIENATLDVTHVLFSHWLDRLRVTLWFCKAFTSR